MKIISHRGNLNGRDPTRENSPKFVIEAVERGFDVEVDVWFVDSKYYLGHDEPQYEVTIDWLKGLPLWCHAKNEQSFSQMLDTGLHFFWHETDRFTLTSRGIPWCFPNNYHKNGVTVVKQSPSELKLDTEVFGICTDHPIEWKVLCQ